jgi:hypothetical protein
VLRSFCLVTKRDMLSRKEGSKLLIRELKAGENLLTIGSLHTPMRVELTVGRLSMPIVRDQ